MRREHAWTLLAMFAGLNRAGYWQPQAPEKIGRSSDEREAERAQKRAARAVRKWEKIERGRIKRETRERGLNAQEAAYRLPEENGPVRLLKGEETIGTFPDTFSALVAIHGAQPRSALWAMNFEGFKIEEDKDGGAI